MLFLNAHRQLKYLISQAGILGGERLLSVDGYPVDQLTPDEAVTLLRGPIGSLVSFISLPCCLY